MPRRRNTETMIQMKQKYITRVETDKYTYFMVRFISGVSKKNISKQKIKKQKLFYLHHFKDELECLAAAIKWRDAQITQQPDFTQNNRSESKLKRKHTKPRGRCPDVGVSLCTRKDRRPSFVASWNETIDGKRVKREKSFSFDPEDREQQYQKALALRKKMEQQHYVGDLKYLKK